MKPRGGPSYEMALTDDVVSCPAGALQLVEFLQIAFGHALGRACSFGMQRFFGVIPDSLRLDSPSLCERAAFFAEVVRAFLVLLVG